MIWIVGDIVLYAAMVAWILRLSSLHLLRGATFPSRRIMSATVLGTTAMLAVIVEGNEFPDPILWTARAIVLIVALGWLVVIYQTREAV